MKLFLNGADTEHQAQILLDFKSRFVGVAFSYIRRSSFKTIEALLKRLKENGCEVFLDPCTNFVASKLVGEWSEDDLAKYWNKYCDVVRAYAYLIDMIGCLDIKSNGYEDHVTRFRQECLELINIETLDCIITPRSKFIRDDDFFSTDMHKNVVIGVPNTLQKSEYDLFLRDNHNKFVREKYRFHAWDITSPDVLKSVPFYSCSTNAWTLGGRYGVVYKYAKSFKLERAINSKSTDAEIKAARVSLKKDVIASGIDYEAFCSSDALTLNCWNCHVFVKYQEELLESKKNREYFNRDSNSNTELVVYGQNESTALATTSDKTSIIDTESEQYKQYTNAIATLRGSKGLNIAKVCNTCAINNDCAMFLENSTCRLESNFDVVGLGGLRASYEAMLNMQLKVLEQRFLEAQIGGGDLDKVQDAIDRSQSMMKGFQEMIKSSAKSTIELRAEGEGVSVLGQLLSNLGKGTSNVQGTHTRPEVRSANKAREIKVIEDMEKETDEIIEAEFEESND